VLKQFQAGVEQIVGLVDVSTDLELLDAARHQPLQKIRLTCCHSLSHVLVQTDQILLAQQGSLVFRQQALVDLPDFPVRLSIAHHQFTGPDKEDQPHAVLHGEGIRKPGVPIQQKIRRLSFGQQNTQQPDKDDAGQQHAGDNREAPVHRRSPSSEDPARAIGSPVSGSRATPWRTSSFSFCSAVDGSAPPGP